MEFTRPTKEEARAGLRDLVEAYARDAVAREVDGSAYSESQARVDFIDKFLRLLGWDVDNAAQKPHSMRDVVVELSTGSGQGNSDDRGRPDYVLRVNGRARLVVEAKKPSVDLDTSGTSARQVRRYGYSMSLPAAVLTNFSQTMIYDARVEPKPADAPHVARIPDAVFSYFDYYTEFDTLWQYLSYEVVSSDEYFDVYDFKEEPRGTSPVDRRFLAQLRSWRLHLARELLASTQFGIDEIGRLTQRILNAVLFLRICEDREIEPYKSLPSALDRGRFDERLRQADETYNAGLFEVLDEVHLSTEVLTDITQDLYWPRSRYAFAVLEPEILAAVYEHYLGERLTVDEDGILSLETKPELLHHGGVVPTPEWVIERLTLMSLSGVDPEIHLDRQHALRVLDPACGSGGFLLAAYRQLARTYEAMGQELSLEMRGAIASDHLFGVDIDPEAVEVARLSLLLAVLGEETIDPASARSVLPDLRDNIRTGNSLIDSRFDAAIPDAAADPVRRSAVQPFDWDQEFPQVLTGESKEGFDIVLGNPPYARIQILAEHMPDQLAFFQHPASGYRSSQAFNFDEYMLFMERGLSLLSSGGVLAFIVPHRFMTSIAGAALRELLLSETSIERIVHFGAQQVFPGRSTYTCLVLLRKR